MDDDDDFKPVPVRKKAKKKAPPRPRDSPRCPLCAVPLTHLSSAAAELHVNGCLDKKEAPKPLPRSPPLRGLE